MIEAVAFWRERTHHRPSLEWVMIDGVNDTDEQAGKLAAIARRLRAHVNLIPLNATPGFPMQGSPPARIRRFAGILERAGGERHHPGHPRARDRGRLRSAPRRARARRRRLRRR
ncbi:MAG: hypothetical protein KatS3mg014_2019 [Actinomycetota bacterium]|nr:MAG: hypothetical protein KatS3mg014_2019 [Actinomycetota bacterium]